MSSKSAKRERHRANREAAREARHKVHQQATRRRKLHAFLVIFTLFAAANTAVAVIATRKPNRPRVVRGPQEYVPPATCMTEEPAFWEARPTFETPPEIDLDPAKTYTAIVDTNCGKFDLALDAKAAPKTVGNFVALARKNYFDGLTWHRVVAGFVIQGGDPRGTGSGGPGYTFEDELPAVDGCRKDEATGRPLCYERGSVAMANSGPDTNGSQFFVVTGPGDALEPNYTLFGKVTKGMEVVDKLASFAQPDLPESDPNFQKPSQKLFIYRVRINEA